MTSRILSALSVLVFGPEVTRAAYDGAVALMRRQAGEIAELREALTEARRIAHEAEDRAERAEEWLAFEKRQTAALDRRWEEAEQATAAALAREADTMTRLVAARAEAETLREGMEQAETSALEAKRETERERAAHATEKARADAAGLDAERWHEEREVLRKMLQVERAKRAEKAS